MENKNIALVLVVAVVLVGFFALNNLKPNGTPPFTTTTSAEGTPTTISTNPTETTEEIPANIPLRLTDNGLQRRRQGPDLPDKTAKTRRTGNKRRLLQIPEEMLLI